ncbi:MAG: aminotransferase DegT [Opitutae bacterium]|nr:aminotransferase DegT [Opitutae bacterium]
MNKFIPVNEPKLKGNEKRYLEECIDTGWISSEGPFVERLENAMAELCNRKHAFAVCNGSAALELAIKAIGVGPGDEVIMPTFTIISCALAVFRVGAKPVYLDSDSKTWNINTADIEALVNEKTKAIMVVHIYGLTVDMDPLLNIAKKYNLKVIEDAAEVIGQTYKGQPCGTFGDISTFSFYPNKHITTGEGGMVLTNNQEVAERCESLRNLCFGKRERFIHKETGWNFRMSNLQAAVGVAQFEQLENNLKKKRKIGFLYQKHFQKCEAFTLPLEKTDYCKNIYWVFGMVSKDSKRKNRWWMRKLAEFGIGTRPFFYPLHKQPCFSHLLKVKKKLDCSESLADFGFYLPSGLTLTEEEIFKISTTLLKITEINNE